MTLRIGAIFTMAALIVGLIFLLRECRQRIVGPERGALPSAVDKAAPSVPPPASQSAAR